MNVYVFGTSISGNYCGRFGRVAREEFGWDDTILDGPSGNAYAIPILNTNNELLDIEIIKENVACFKIYALIHKDDIFLISEMLPFRPRSPWDTYYDVLFKKLPENCIFV